MGDKDGWVYVLTNEAMPGLVKVGYTSREPSVRAEELYRDTRTGAVTGVPVPFVVAHQVWVANPYQVEQAVHRSLAEKRLNDNREFFKCSYEEAVQHINEVIKAKSEQSKREADSRLPLFEELEKREEAEKIQLILEERRVVTEKFQANETSKQIRPHPSNDLQKESILLYHNIFKKEQQTKAKIKNFLYDTLAYLTLLIIIFGICFQFWMWMRAFF